MFCIQVLHGCWVGGERVVCGGDWIRLQARAYCNSSETSCMHVGNGNYLYLLRHSYM